MYKDLTIGHRSWIKRFSHTSRFNKAFSILEETPGRQVLDFGAGDGNFARMLLSRVKRVAAYEPTDDMYKQLVAGLHREIGTQAVFATRQLSSLSGKKFDTIYCLEVLEHLPPLQLEEALEQLRALASGDGIIVISVPIEIGLGGFLKFCARRMIGQVEAGGSWWNALKSAFLLPVPRAVCADNPSYISSHVGFSHLALQKLLKARGFEIKRKIYSPFPFLRGLINSQVFFVIKLSRQ